MIVVIRGYRFFAYVIGINNRFRQSTICVRKSNDVPTRIGKALDLSAWCENISKNIVKNTRAKIAVMCLLVITNQQHGSLNFALVLVLGSKKKICLGILARL